MQVSLGSFTLVEPLGKGGMGEVWRGRHTALDRDVAVKIDLHPPAVEASTAFLHEVAIIAGLDHPNVARILEHGTVPRHVQAATEGHFREGSRWLAMELAPGGSVRQRPPRTWDEVLHVLRGALKGLAHAHARGVIHRDIKPDNLLLAGPEVGIESIPRTLLEARVLLADFGISELRDQPSTNTDDAIGTPSFMAPEQIEARWRDQGPWTDLYAVGVLLWRLTTGVLPYTGKNAFAVYRGHLFQPVRTPVLLPGFPAGLAPVLRRCLAKDPGDRYRFAVELLRDLEVLTPNEDVATGMALEELPTERNPTLDTEAETGGDAVASADFAKAGGLSLFGLQVPPLVGRQDACSVIWERLARTTKERRAQVCIVRADEGLGRTRLAHWLCEQAHEQGIADHWFVAHQRDAERGSVLPSVLAKELRTEGLEPDELLERLQQRFGHALDPRRLLPLLAPDAAQLRPSPREQRAALLAVLQAVANQQPLVLVLEDVHFDPEALELVDHLLALEHRSPSPLFVLVTVQEQGLAGSPEAAELLDDLTDDPAVTPIVLHPLDAAARRRLSRSLVGLEGGVSQRLEERTAGNPQFAVELVRTWIAQGILAPGPRGYRLDRDAEQAMPAGLRAIWARRLDDAMGARTVDDRTAVEAAACLGATVDADALAHVLRLLEIRPDPSLFPTLASTRLLDTTERGWSFAHGLVRELLKERSVHDDRWIDVNLAVAIHLEESRSYAPARLAAHLIAAEEHERAIEPLFQAVYDFFDRGDARDGTLMQTLEDCFDALGLEHDDARRGRHLVIAAMIARERQGPEAALRLIDDTMARFHHPLVRALAMRELARLHHASRDPERALPFAQQALSSFEEIEEGLRAADTQQLLGRILIDLGDVEAGRGMLLASLARIDANGWQAIAYEPLYGLALLEQRRRDLAAARAWLGRLEALTEARGMQASAARVANLQGEIARSSGDEAAAASYYAVAVEAYESLNDPGFVFPLLNLGVLDIRAERFAVATARMRRLLNHFERSPARVPRMFCQVVLFAATASQGDVPAALEALAGVQETLAEVAVVDADLAGMAEVGGRALTTLGEPAGAEALALAIDQYERLGRDEDAARLR